jgi:CelD/BcsL family acetyltransferase involved in cellulose biosynthesis
MADLTLGVEAYWARFSSKTRFNLKRNVKLLTKAAGGTLDWRRYTTAAEAAEFHRLALPLSMRTYQHKLFQGGLPDSAVFLDHMAAAAERGDVRAYLLFMQGEVIAYLYLVAENGILAYSYVGHDAGRAQWSPGSVLMTLAMEDVQAEGRFRWMDFGSGHGQHKSVFSTEAVPVAHVYLLPPTLRNRWIVWTHDLLARFSSALTAFLHQHDLHSRLKRLVRRMASTSPGQTP